MPSSKPQVKTVIDEEIAEKFKAIAKEQNRSTSNLLGIIVTEYVRNYEQKNGAVNQVNIGRDNHGAINF